ncbi:TPA: acyltransferase [Aeromonas sobria]|nr:acyltransferase [Aeromonas sobria]
MELLPYNGFFFACVLIATFINFLFYRFNFYSHIDFSSERYFHVDGIRGIAAIFVVMNHLVFSFENNGFKPSDVEGLNFWLFAHAGDIGVQIFFCITGFLFADKIIKTNNNLDWNNFFSSRIKRLVPMYLIATVIVSVLTLAWSNGTQPIVTTIRQLITLFGFGFLGSDIWVNGFRTFSLNAVIWTLPYEWKFYCILPLVCAGLRFKRLFSLSCVLVFLYALNDLYLGQAVWVYFISGALTAYIHNRYPININAKSFSNKITSSIIVFSSLVYLLNSNLSGYGYERFIITSLLFLFVVITKPWVLTAKPLVYLGEASYSSYLLHLIINAITLRVLSGYMSLDDISSLGFWSILFFLVIITTIFTAFTFKYIECKFINVKLSIPQAKTISAQFG